MGSSEIDEDVEVVLFFRVEVGFLTLSGDTEALFLRVDLLVAEVGSKELPRLTDLTVGKAVVVKALKSSCPSSSIWLFSEETSTIGSSSETFRDLLFTVLRGVFVEGLGGTFLLGVTWSSRIGSRASITWDALIREDLLVGVGSPDGTLLLPRFAGVSIFTTSLSSEAALLLLRLGVLLED